MSRLLREEEAMVKCGAKSSWEGYGLGGSEYNRALRPETRDRNKGRDKTEERIRAARAEQADKSGSFGRADRCGAGR
jgi:hypothetical protein